MERLQKVIANCGYCSRRHAEELIRQGLVTVNGVVVCGMGEKVRHNDKIEVEGVLLDNRKDYEYYINGQTGKVYGTLPKSISKIIFTGGTMFAGLMLLGKVLQYVVEVF